MIIHSIIYLQITTGKYNKDISKAFCLKYPYYIFGIEFLHTEIYGYLFKEQSPLEACSFGETFQDSR